MLVSRMKAGCAVPWHWHTPNEHVMVVSGTLRMEMKDNAQPLVLKAGGYALMPSHHIHAARCIEACTLFIHSDARFDIHYVDARGNEIKPEQALEALARPI